MYIFRGVHSSGINFLLKFHPKWSTLSDITERRKTHDTACQYQILLLALIEGEQVARKQVIRQERNCRKWRKEDVPERWSLGKSDGHKDACNPEAMDVSETNQVTAKRQRRKKAKRRPAIIETRTMRKVGRIHLRTATEKYTNEEEVHPWISLMKAGRITR